MKHLPYQAYPNLLNNLYGIPESRGVAIDRALDRLHDALCHCDKRNRKAFEEILGPRIILEVELWAKTKFGLEDELLDPETRKNFLNDAGYAVCPYQVGEAIHAGTRHWEVLGKVKDHPENMTPNDLQLFDDPNR
ncbi:MAG: hypothetical protein CBB68_13230 [Rhodospirillaceae bacterium TMED8]|nr:MAG: hypothetical protein CBB68_13230 [Rhodospirillaceae bacterium TMED8]